MLKMADVIERRAADYALAYGEDDGCEQARGMIREAFEAPEAAVHFVTTGTAANSLALACLCPPWGGVYCHDGSHIHVDECNGPEFYTGGAKLVLAEGALAPRGQAILDLAPHDGGRWRALRVTTTLPEAFEGLVPTFESRLRADSLELVPLR